VRNAFHDWCARNRPSEILNDENESVDGAADLTAVGPEQAAVRKAEAGLRKGAHPWS